MKILVTGGKAIKYLDWEPQINLEDGLNKTIKYFKLL